MSKYSLKMKNILLIKNIIWIILIGVLLQLSCAKKENQTYFLVTGEAAEEVELNAINDLKNDLAKVIGGEIIVLPETEKIPSKGVVIILGTQESNSLIAKMVDEQKLQLSNQIPGPRGGIWEKTELSEGQTAIVIGGSDVQGLQYAIYDYSKEILGVDALEYWTGKLPEPKTPKDLFDFESKRIAPPKVPLLCYFENDVDELANYRGKLLEYDWESYTEMINSLVRLRYNAIQLFDMLGRPEFFIRPEYRELHPNYKVDIAYVEKMIDYAQSKGMKVAIDFALGYQIHPMSAEKATCWSTYKEDWIQAWRYYLEETPLSKTDIFMLRSRHQVWDWEYESSCGEDKIDVFNEVYKAFGDLIDEYKPKAEKVLVCYADGMEMWNDGFRPPKDWIVCWSDNGFGDYEFLPNTTDEYDFGTYMHAGFWLNHTVHNPYPEKIEAVMKTSFKDLEAYKFCLVNGQNFRPFLLNLEAYSDVCNEPEKFDGNTFYGQWSQRYFDKEVATYAVKSMKLLNQAQSVDRIGYVQHLWEIREAIAYLSNSPIERPGKPPVPYEFERVQNDIQNVGKIKKLLHNAVEEAKKGLELKTNNDNFYYSYIYLPAVLYSDIIAFETTLHEMSLLKREFENTNKKEALDKAIRLQQDLEGQLNELYKNRLEGDRNPKWAGWYDPKIRRPNNGFPSKQMLEAIKANLVHLKNSK